MRETIVEQFLTDERILEFDPYADECEVKYQTIKIVKTRKEQKCMGVPGVDGLDLHPIPAGTRARHEKAMIDGEWGSYYTCIDCIKKSLVQMPEYFTELDDQIRQAEAGVPSPHHPLT
jgi:hypothetical protein